MAEPITVEAAISNLRRAKTTLTAVNEDLDNLTNSLSASRDRQAEAEAALFKAKEALVEAALLNT